MKRLWMLVMCAGCASAETAKQGDVQVAERSAAVCPPTRTAATGALDSVLGKHVDKVCLVGGAAELSAVVAGAEGQPLEAVRVEQLLHELFATGLVRDADAVATPVDAERVVLTWFITPYDAIANIRVMGAQGVGGEAFVQLTPDRFAYANPATLKSLEEAFLDIYEERGYPRATVAVAMAQADAVVSVDEGTRDDVKRIRFSGVKRVKDAELREVVRTLEGSVYVADVPMRDVTRLEDFYRDRGMVQAIVKSSYQDGELLFTVSEGDVFKLGALRLSGAAVPEGPALLASLGSKRGFIFSRTALIRDIEHIRAHASRNGTPVNVTPLTTVDAKRKTIDVTFELSPAR